MPTQSAAINPQKSSDPLGGGDLTMIHLIEELSMNAWPALQTQLYDGWVLRFAGGYTRRANCINPLYPNQVKLGEKIEACERIYREQKLPAIYKLTPGSLPDGLDAALDAHGYALEAPTSVQVLELDGQSYAAEGQVSLWPRLTEEWYVAFNRLSAGKPASQSLHARMLQTILPRCAFAALRVGGRIAGCGLAVAQNGWVGLFDIIVDPQLRRQGLGLSLMNNLLAWGQAQAAHSAYLQVMKDNPPALGLYARLGFHEAYPYWYRVKPV
jgi:N-acetylglutamate synthase